MLENTKENRDKILNLFLNHIPKERHRNFNKNRRVWTCNVGFNQSNKEGLVIRGGTMVSEDERVEDTLEFRREIADKEILNISLILNSGIFADGGDVNLSLILCGDDYKVDECCYLNNCPYELERILSV